MIKSLVTVLALPLLATSAYAQQDPRALHLDLEMTGQEWRQLESKLGGLRGIGAELEGDDPLQDVLALGKRNLDWLSALNAARPANTKLELSTPATQRGIPITAPKVNNRGLVVADVATVKAAMPATMSAILWGSGALPAALPADVSDDTYLVYARLLDRAYQSASRWLLQEPWLAEYAEYSVKDVRGYYFLTREEGLDVKFASWDTLDEATKTKLGDWLVGMCRNSEVTVSACRAEFDKIVAKNGTPRAFYDLYLQIGKDTFDAFFTLQNPRPEAEWSSDMPNTFTLPFTWPDREDVLVWLAVNIEDEWRLGDWQLKLLFDRTRTELAKVEFIAGTTPHVNGLGGDTITMDANRDLEEYSTRWTIRHEFGHVLGLPDCYVEFYEPENGVMVNYQIDVEDLMCSRRGKIQARHVEELRRAYYRE